MEIINRPLDSNDIKKAIQILKEASKKPFLDCIKSRHDWYKTIQESNTARNFHCYGGTPLYQDESIPEGIIRFEMSDGTFTDCPYMDKPLFTTACDS